MLRRRPLKPRHQNILATVTGLVLGAILNSLLVELGPRLIPVPAGLEMSSMEGIRRSMPQLPAANFLFPWLAHALGTFGGALAASRLAAPGAKGPAAVIGVFFLAGGIAMVVAVGGPLWFLSLDLGLAYLPMAWLGYRLGSSKSSN
jgi:hypothetical protein